MGDHLSHQAARRGGRDFTGADAALARLERVSTAECLRGPGIPRGRIAAALALDFVVDDRPENCLDVAVDSKARAILVWRGDESELPATARRLGIAVVKSVADCLDILVQIDAKPRNEAD